MVRIGCQLILSSQTDIMDKWSSSQKQLFGFISLILLNILLKAIYLDYPVFGHDEPFTLFRIQQTYTELLTALADNNHPPLWETLMWVWHRLVGYNVSLLRILPLICSISAVLMLFELGRRFHSFTTGLMASTAFSFSNFFILLSHDIRSYSLLSFLGLVFVYAYLMWRQSGSTKAWLIFSLVGLQLIYTHYFGLFILLAVGAHALFLSRERRTQKGILLSAVLIAMGYIPQILMVSNRFVQKVEKGHWLAEPSFEYLFNLLKVFFNLPVVSVGVLLLLLLFLWQLIKRRDSIVGLKGVVVVIFPTIYLINWLVSQYQSIFYDRYVSFSIPFAFLLIAIAINELKIKQLVRSGLFLVFIGGMIGGLQLKPSRANSYRELAAYLHQRDIDKVAVRVHPKWALQELIFHYDTAIFKQYRNMEGILEKENIHFAYSIQEEELRSILKGHEALWMIDQSGWPKGLPKELEGIGVNRREIDGREVFEFYSESL